MKNIKLEDIIAKTDDEYATLLFMTKQGDTAYLRSDTNSFVTLTDEETEANDSDNILLDDGTHVLVETAIHGIYGEDEKTWRAAANRKLAAWNLQIDEEQRFGVESYTLERTPRGVQLYDVTITYRTDPGMLGRDGSIHASETGTLEHNGLTSGQVRTLLRKYMDTQLVTPMNSLRPFDVHVEPQRWRELQAESIARRDEANDNLLGNASDGEQPGA